MITYYDENGQAYREPIPNPAKKQLWKYDDQKRLVSCSMILMSTQQTVEHEMWNYFSDGGKEQYIIQNTDNGERISTLRLRWDKNGNETYYEHCDSTGNTTEAIERTYDTAGNKLTEEWWTPTSDTVVWSKTAYYINGNPSRTDVRFADGKTSWSTYWENGNNKEISSYQQSTGEEDYIQFNEQGIRIYEKKTVSGFVTDEVWYSDQGVPVKSATTDISGQRTVVEYDANGRESKHTVYTADGKKYSELMITYHSNGKEHKKVYSDIDGNGSEYIFNEAGVCETMISASSDGSATEYHYWDDGMTAKYECLISASGDKTETHYSRNAKKLSSTENWSGGTRVEITYNANEKESERLMYDPKGVLLSTTVYEYHSTELWLCKMDQFDHISGQRYLVDYDRYGRDCHSYVYEGSELISESLNEYWDENSGVPRKSVAYNRDRSYSVTEFYQNGSPKLQKEYTAQGECTREVHYDEDGNEIAAGT